MDVSAGSYAFPTGLSPESRNPVCDTGRFNAAFRVPGILSLPVGGASIGEDRENECG